MNTKFYITLKGFKPSSGAEGFVEYTTSKTVFLAPTPDDGNPRRMVSLDFADTQFFDSHEEIWERMEECDIDHCKVWQLSEKELFHVKLRGGVGAPHERA